MLACASGLVLAGRGRQPFAAASPRPEPLNASSTGAIAVEQLRSRRALALQSGRRPAVLLNALPIPAVPEDRIVVLESPSRIRLGDFDIIRLVFQATQAQAIVSAAKPAASAEAGVDQSFQNAYEDYRVVAQAQLDLAGMLTTPNGPVSEPLVAAEPAVFAWSVRADSPGTYHGTVWLFLVFVDKRSGAQSRIPISAQPIRIEVMSLMQVSGSTARIAGSLGLVAAILFGLPFAIAAYDRIWRGRRGGA